MFERPHHQRIAQVLLSLDAPLLRSLHCLFGGGTAIALRCAEYRESVDIDFLVSNQQGFRTLRETITGPRGLEGIIRAGVTAPAMGKLRSDQYGIRSSLLIGGVSIKFEIILEGRIELAEPTPQDQLCGISTLTLTDMAASKMLANSDRGMDDGVMSRDLLDLAMLGLPRKQLLAAVAKAEGAYGTAIRRDVQKAITRLRERDGWLERCMQTMAVSVPRALLWERVRTLEKRLAG